MAIHDARPLQRVGTNQLAVPASCTRQKENSFLAAPSSHFGNTPDYSNTIVLQQIKEKTLRRQKRCQQQSRKNGHDAHETAANHRTVRNSRRGKKKTPKECSWKQQARNPTPSCCRQGSTDMKNERSCCNVEEKKKKEQQKQLQKKNPLHYSAF